MKHKPEGMPLNGFVLPACLKAEVDADCRDREARAACASASTAESERQLRARSGLMGISLIGVLLVLR